MKSRREKNAENRIYHVYEAIGKDYNKIQDIRTLGMHRVIKHGLAREVAKLHPEKVLDVCCGTGGLSFAIAGESRDTWVDGVDFSDEMISLANEKKRKEGVRRVVFHRENAKCLPFADNTYDCAVCAFGVLEVDDPVRLLAQMRRVLKPGGVIYLLERSVCQDSNVKMAAGLYEKSVAPAINELLTGKGFESRWMSKVGKKPQTKEQMARVLQQMGFHQICYRSCMGGLAAVHRAVK